MSWGAGCGAVAQGSAGLVRRQREWEESLDLLLLLLVKRHRPGGAGWLRTGERGGFWQLPGCGAVSLHQAPGRGVIRAAKG